MAEWTQDAYEYLDGYLTQVSALAKRQGDDAAEIVSGLRDHIAQECESTAGGTVDIDDLLAALAVIGSPEDVVSLDTPLRGRGVSPPHTIAPQQVVVKKSLWLQKSVIIIISILLLIMALQTWVISWFPETITTGVMSTDPPSLEKPKLVESRVMIPGGGSESALHHAAKGGHMGSINELLDEGLDIDLQDEFGNTMLHYAAMHGHNGMVRNLLEKGADANILNKDGVTALHYAIDNGHELTAAELKMYTTVDVFEWVDK